MSTTSNSRGNAFRLAFILAALVTLGPVTIGRADDPAPKEQPPAEKPVPPDAPLPAEKTPAVEGQPPRVDVLGRHVPVELKSVAIRKLDRDKDLKTMRVNTKMLAEAKEPLVIEVRAAMPFDLRPQTSWPVIVLNGEVLRSSQFARNDPTKLVAVVPNRAMLKDRNRVEVYWVGRESSTRTKKPLTFRPEDVK